MDAPDGLGHGEPSVEVDRAPVPFWNRLELEEEGIRRRNDPRWGEKDKEEQCPKPDESTRTFHFKPPCWSFQRKSQGQSTRGVPSATGGPQAGKAPPGDAPGGFEKTS